MKRVSFLGYPVDNLTMAEALLWIKDSTYRRESKTIVVINANKLWLANWNCELSQFIKNADLLPPEYAVVWGAKQMGISLNHIGGVMLLKAFLPFAEREAIRPYFLGAKPEVIQNMVIKIKNDYPNLLISGFHHGYLKGEKIKKAVIEDIFLKRPDIVFIAMGSPKQENLIYEFKQIRLAPVIMGVGGSFDVISGEKKDAPSWARSKGLEWIYRIYQDPLNTEYWRRYLVTNIWFVFKVYIEKILNLTSG